jgi:hypothetical protein
VGGHRLLLHKLVGLVLIGRKECQPSGKFTFDRFFRC